MRRREALKPTEIPAWILGQQWQGFAGEETAHRQDAWEAACRSWAHEHGMTMADLHEAIAEWASRLLYDPASTQSPRRRVGGR